MTNETKKINKNFIEFCKKFCIYAVGIITLVSFIFLLLLRINYRTDRVENLDFKWHISYEVIINVLAIILFIYIIYKFYKFLLTQQNSDKKKILKIIFFSGAIIYGIFTLFMSLKIKRIFFGDARIVFNAAEHFKNGNKLFKHGGYFNYYPHQTGILAYYNIFWEIAKIFGKGYKVAFVLAVFTNYFLTLGIILIQSKISKILFNENNITIFTTIFSFAFLPLMFFIPFLYGHTVGFFFCILAMYLLLKVLIPSHKKNEISKYNNFFSKKEILNIILSSLCFGIAVVLRNNFIIFIITAIIILILNSIKRLEFKNIFIILCIIMSIYGLKFLNNKYFELRSGEKIGKAHTPLLWVEIGLDNGYVKKSKNFPGWFNRYNNSKLIEHKFNHDKIEADAKRDIKKLLVNYKNHPDQFAKFITQKWATTWAEPTFSSIWSIGINSKFTTNWYKIIYIIFNTITSVIYLGIIVYSYYSIKYINTVSIYELYPIIYFIGGFLFHSFWETKSQYVMVYILALIPIASKGMIKLLYKLNNNNNNNNNKGLIPKIGTNNKKTIYSKKGV